jgi:uncharacterized protein
MFHQERDAVSTRYATVDTQADMPQPNADLIHAFYSAFQRRDAEAMGACYAPDVHFEDPVFTLDGWRARAMWRMLCERGTDLRVTFADVAANGASGSARWEAWYTFSAGGRPVHNVIRASFTFAGGRIVRHTDTFDFHRWARQALGPAGLLFGWTPPMRSAVRRRAARALEGYIRANGLGDE